MISVKKFLKTLWKIILGNRKCTNCGSYNTKAVVRDVYPGIDDKPEFYCYDCDQSFY